MGAVTQFTREAEQMLRAGGRFDWSTVTLLALVVYVYAVEVRARATGARCSPARPFG